MNENHAQLCPSPGWAAHLQDEVLPFLVSIASLGETMLELGPGPGAATQWLHPRVRRLIAVERDELAAERLSERFAGTNVEVVTGDATDLELATASFDSVGSFTMLHHVTSFSGQHRLLLEAYRVLKPGGFFLGSDSQASNGLHHFHQGDDYNPIDPAAFLTQLRAVGFEQLTLVVDGNMKFVARKPDSSTSEQCNNETKE